MRCFGSRALALALLAASSLACATLPPAEHTLCPEHPMALTRVEVTPEELVLTAEELRGRVSELTPNIRFDAPAGIVTPELTTWFGKSDLGPVNCLRERDGGYRQLLAKVGEEEHYVSLPAHSIASTGKGGRELVAIRTGKKLSYYAIWVETEVHFNLTYDSFSTGYDYATLDLTTVLPDAPETYLYLIEDNKPRWGLDDDSHPPIILIPVVGGELDLGRVGYVISLHPPRTAGESRYFVVRRIRAAA